MEYDKLSQAKHAYFEAQSVRAKGYYDKNRRLIPDQPLPVVVIPKDKQEDTNKK